jgi:hypothetical protein
MSEYKFGTWYPIVAAPQNSEWILVVESDGDTHIAIWGRHPLDVDNCMDKCWTTGYLEVRPTHWMPLPPPPVEELTLFPDCASLIAPAKSKDWPGFNAFWGAYPKKEGKKPAVKAWNKEKPDIQEVAKALAWQTQTEQWRKGYIPIPTTYLNQRRWEDERPPETKPEQVYQ